MSQATKLLEIETELRRTRIRGPWTLAPSRGGPAGLRDD